SPSTEGCLGLKLYNGRVLKPFQSKNRGETELAFYEHVLPLRLPFLPAFFGVLELQADDDSSDLRRYLQLEDLLHGMTKPCIMDVKIGTKSYEPNASADKMALEAAKSPLQAIVGFRLQGIKVYCDGGYVSLDKHYMRTLSTLDEVVDGGFRKYVAAAGAERRQLLMRLQAKVNAMVAWFDSQTTLHFIASSLLFVYDAADATRGDVRLIDFAHVQFDQSTRDEGVRTGLRTVSSILAQLHE
ncbi:hypothetical protein As57867_014302, partial [Aphanomyces stellatus]